MNREDAVKLWKRIQYMSDVGRVQWQHRGYLKEDDQNFLLDGLRVKSLREKINEHRSELRAVPLPKRWKADAETVIRGLVKHVMGIDSYSRSRRTAVVNVGGEPKAQRDKINGAYRYLVTVGYMWHRKVYEPLYRGTALKNENWLILSAEKVRVNDKNITLYEVSAYNYETDERTTAYVAQTKTASKHTAFGKTVKLAVSRANWLLSEELNKALMGDMERKEA